MRSATASGIPAHLQTKINSNRRFRVFLGSRRNAPPHGKVQSCASQVVRAQALPCARLFHTASSVGQSRGRIGWRRRNESSSGCVRARLRYAGDAQRRPTKGQAYLELIVVAVSREQIAPRPNKLLMYRRRFCFDNSGNAPLASRSKYSVFHRKSSSGVVRKSAAIISTKLILI